MPEYPDHTPAPSANGTPRKKRVSVDRLDPGRGRLLDVLRNDFPSYPPDGPGHLQEDRNYTGVVFLAVSAFRRAISAATPQLVRRRKKKHPTAVHLKALPTPGQQANDQEFVPVHGHPFARLLRKPNPGESFAEFHGRAVLQFLLHGRVLVWGPGPASDPGGPPVELYVLPAGLSIPGGVSAEHPKGSWRVSVYAPAGVAGLSGSAQVVIDKREVYELKEPHPSFPWAAYSPLSGLKTQTDLVQKIDRSCWSAMDRGVRPDMIITAPGLDQDQVKEIQRLNREQHQGPDNQGGPYIVAGGDPGAPIDVHPWGVAAKDMDYGGAWDRYLGFVLAALGMDRSVVGLKESGSYSENWARIQNFQFATLRPWCSRFGSFLTEGPLRDWDIDDRLKLRVQIDLPTIDDPALLGEKVTRLATHHLATVNELRGFEGLPPVAGGDVLPDVYAQLQMQEHAPPQPDPGQAQPGAPATGGGPFRDHGRFAKRQAGGDDPGPGLAALGLGGGGKAGNPPPAGPPVPRPPAGAGGQPGPVVKAWDESKHPRDHGKFSSSPGSGGDAPPAGGKGDDPTPPGKPNRKAGKAKAGAKSKPEPKPKREGPHPKLVAGYRAAADYLAEYGKATTGEMTEVLADAGVPRAKAGAVIDHLYNRGLFHTAAGESPADEGVLVPHPHTEHAAAAGAAVNEYLSDYGEASHAELVEHLKDQGHDRDAAETLLTHLYHSGEVGRRGGKYAPRGN